MDRPIFFSDSEFQKFRFFSLKAKLRMYSTFIKQVDLNGCACSMSLSDKKKIKFCVKYLVLRKTLQPESGALKVMKNVKDEVFFTSVFRSHRKQWLRPTIGHYVLEAS